jgi:hypothetical protein
MTEILPRCTHHQLRHLVRMLGANLIVEGAVVGPGSHGPFSRGIRVYMVLHIEEVVHFITENKQKKNIYIYTYIRVYTHIFYILPNV